jgi:nucleolar GTP-binding protein
LNTLSKAGFPNVGKSSLINLLTRANVEVQPYAFTTKSLYVGHMDYKYLNWQVIDTPGILDHELEERNAIEWQSVTALAHLKAAIIYIIDISEQCGTPIQIQIDLFMKIKPLFNNKPVFVMLNKIDVKPFDELSAENKEILTKFQEQEGVTFHHTSNVSKEGIMAMRNEACDKLLLQRVEAKLRGTKAESIMSRLRVAMPEKRDDVERPAFIPDQACQLRADAEKRPGIKTLRQTELELDDEYVLDLRRTWDLKNAEEAYDAVPELWEGKNIADFVDPDILEKLDALEKEEDEREKTGFYKLDGLEYDSDDMEIHEMAKRIRKKRKINKIESRLEDKGIGRSKLPRKNANQLEEKMVELGIGEHIKQGKGNYKSDETIHRGRSVARKRTRLNNGDAMDTNYNNEDGVATRSKSRNRSASHLRRAPRDKSGMRDDQAEKARKLMKKVQKPMTLSGQIADSDRRYTEKMPKHLFSGKRGKGKTDRR